MFLFQQCENTTHHNIVLCTALFFSGSSFLQTGPRGEAKTVSWPWLLHPVVSSSFFVYIQGPQGCLRGRLVQNLDISWQRQGAGSHAGLGEQHCMQVSCNAAVNSNPKTTLLRQYGLSHVVSCFLRVQVSDGGRSREDVALAGLLLPLVH